MYSKQFIKTEIEMEYGNNIETILENYGAIVGIFGRKFPLELVYEVLEEYEEKLIYLKIKKSNKPVNRKVVFDGINKKYHNKIDNEMKNIGFVIDGDFFKPSNFC